MCVCVCVSSKHATQKPQKQSEQQGEEDPTATSLRPSASQRAATSAVISLASQRRPLARQLDRHLDWQDANKQQPKGLLRGSPQIDVKQQTNPQEHMAPRSSSCLLQSRHPGLI